MHRHDDKLLQNEFNSHLVLSKTAMAEGGGLTGGYVVPPDLTFQLMKVMAESSILRPRAFVQPMSSATLDLPVPDITSTPPSAASPFLGGVQCYWTEEAQTETETAVKDIHLKAHELAS
jgi:HK97 family phage major capsid protein